MWEASQKKKERRKKKKELKKKKKKRMCAISADREEREKEILRVMDELRISSIKHKFCDFAFTV